MTTGDTVQGPRNRTLGPSLGSRLQAAPRGSALLTCPGLCTPSPASSHGPKLTAQARVSQRHSLNVCGSMNERSYSLGSCGRI